MPKRYGKATRQMRSRNKYYEGLERAMYTFANANRAEMRGNLTTGPERTPPCVMTPDQRAAYVKNWIEETLGKDDHVKGLP